MFRSNRQRKGKVMKELWIEAHEELIEEYLDGHPDADPEWVAGMLCDKATERMQDKFADMIDAAKERAKLAGECYLNASKGR